MITLRWVLGVSGALFAIGFIALALIGNAFRKSFGASALGPLTIILPAIALVLLVAATVAPTCKPLLHAAAISALGLIAYFLWEIFTHGEIPLWFAIAYLGLWLSYYWLALEQATLLP